MSSDELAERVLGAARRSADQTEVFVLEADETPVRFEANRLKQISSRRTSGLALRVVKNGRIGFASSTAPGDVENLVAMALDVAQFGAEAKFDVAEAAEYPPVDVCDEAVEAVSAETMVQLGQTVIDRIRADAAELLCEASVHRVVQRIRLLTSGGADASYKRTIFAVHAEGTLVRGTDMLFLGDGEASCRLMRSGHTIAEAILQQLAWARETAPAVTTKRMPVVFTPQGFASTFLAPLASAFSGRSVLQGSSPIGHRKGEAVYDHQLSIVDDATIAFRPSSRSFDAEGVASRRVPLIDRGVVANFLYDRQTAGLAGVESTGHGERSLSTLPSISPATLMVEPGPCTFEEMLSDIDEGIVVEVLMGATQGNVQGGDFSGNVLLGYKVERGKIVGRVKNTMVAGNAHEALANIVAIGSEPRWVGGSIYLPAIAFAELSVSTVG
ncbi:MAG TPA: TldD/PmbA family protein [Dehalococcoidia bacterium]|nr:TldD/PmbA family protein [Dehalococcoidia bacterium]